MENKSRKDILIRNTKFGAIKTIVQYFLQFVLRTVLIYTLGSSYIGLNGLFSNIIGCLSIVELGLGSAIVFSMYKPIAENDVEKVKSLNYLYKKIYRILAVIITCLGIAILPFLRFMIEGDVPADVNIYIIYLLTLLNTILGYIWADKRSLLYAYQRSDIESKVGIIQSILLYGVQIIILLTTHNYHAFISCMPIFTIFENLILSKQVEKVCPNLKGKAIPVDKEISKELKKNVIGSSMQQIGGVFVISTDNIIISAMLGLAILGAYTNYATIISAITTCIALITTNARSVLGNMIASENTEYVYKRYNTLNFAMYWIAGFCSISLLCLLNPFIYIWTNGNLEYLLSLPIIIILVLNFFISNTLSITSNCTFSAGLMWQNKWKTIIQGIVNIITSIIFVKLWGLIGVFLGTLASYIVAPLWMDSFVLFKYYFKKSSKIYWLKYVVFAVVTFIAGLITYMLCALLPEGILWFIIKGIICLVVPNLIYLLVYFKAKEFKECLEWVKSLLKNFKRKKIKNEDK